MQRVDLPWGTYFRVGHDNDLDCQVYECQVCGALVRVKLDTDHDWERPRDGRAHHDAYHRGRGEIR